MLEALLRRFTPRRGSLPLTCRHHLSQRIGSDSSGQAYNINADTVAGAIAGALGAEKAVYLTDVPGLLTDIDLDPTGNYTLRFFAICRWLEMTKEGSFSHAVRVRLCTSSRSLEVAGGACIVAVY